MESSKNKKSKMRGTLQLRHRSTAMVLAALITLTGILTGCGKGSSVVGSSSGVVSAAGANSSVGTVNTASSGNTPSNIANGGLAVQSGDWIYFVGYNMNGTYDDTTDDNYNISKVKTDGSNRTTLLNKDSQWGFSNLNVVGDWIYFVSFSSPDNSESDRVATINRMHTDGSSRTKLYSTKTGKDEGFLDFINVIGDWIYFTELSYSGATPGESSIDRMHTDGSSLSKLIVEESTATVGGLGYLTADNGWLYYEKCGASGGNGKGFDTINKMKMDGTAKTQLLAGSSSESIAFAAAVGDWVYYSANFNTVSHTAICKVRIDGSGSTEVIDSTSGETPYLDSVNVANDWVYYHGVVGKNNYLSKIRTDGTGKTHIADLGDEYIACFNINIAGDWLYDISASMTKKTREADRIKIDGTNAQTVS